MLDDAVHVNALARKTIQVEGRDHQSVFVLRQV